MVCPTCQQDIPAHLATCPYCSTPVNPLAPVIPEMQTPADADAKISVSQQRRWVTILYVGFALLLTAGSVFLNYLRALNWAGTLNPESSGYMVGGCLVSFGLGLLIAFLYFRVRRQKPSASKRFFVVSSAALVFTLLAFAGSTSETAATRDANLKHQVGDLLKQAAGKAPPTSGGEWWQDPVREFSGDLIKFNQQYALESAGLDDKALKQMYSSDSYSSPAKMRKILTELQSTWDIDRKYASLDPIIDAMKQRIRVANVSEKTKEDFLQGFNSSVQTSRIPAEKTFEKKKEWIDASTDLYQFTLANQQNFAVKNGKLLFRSDALAAEFKEKQSHAINLQKDFLEAQKNAASFRAQKLGEVGLSPSDLETKPNSVPPSR